MHTDSTPREGSTPILDRTDMLAGMSPTSLAEAVSVDGFDTHSVTVAAFVGETRRLRINDVLAEIVLDLGQPIVARERAFGRLVVAYCRAIERGTTDPLRSSACFTVAA